MQKAIRESQPGPWKPRCSCTHKARPPVSKSSYNTQSSQDPDLARCCIEHPNDCSAHYLSRLEATDSGFRFQV